MSVLRLSLLAVLLVALTGCKVQVNKSGDGEADNVKIATPFGAIAVNKDQTTPAELGLPAYPGSVLERGDDNKSAKVDMGFGSWRLRVKVAHYATPDNRDQVLAFYRKALSEYGRVIECAGNKSVSIPAATPEGLTCDKPGGQGNPENLTLKAGSPRHQHLVIVQPAGTTATRYSLIALDLPHGFDTEQKGTN
jgi:hypothetical protein